MQCASFSWWRLHSLPRDTWQWLASSRVCVDNDKPELARMETCAATTVKMADNDLSELSSDGAPHAKDTVDIPIALPSCCCRHCSLQLCSRHCRLPLHCHLSAGVYCDHNCAAVLPSIAPPPPLPNTIMPPDCRLPWRCCLSVIAHRCLAAAPPSPIATATIYCNHNAKHCDHATIPLSITPPPPITIMSLSLPFLIAVAIVLAITITAAPPSCHQMRHHRCCPCITMHWSGTRNKITSEAT